MTKHLSGVTPIDRSVKSQVGVSYVVTASRFKGTQSGKSKPTKSGFMR